MSEKDGEKHDFSYMDGIPVKISEKYKPPRKIILPVGFQNRLLQPPVTADYNFQVEEEVLAKLQLWRQSRSSEKETRKRRIEEEDAKVQKMQETLQELEDTMHEMSTEDESSRNQKSSLSPTPSEPLAQQPVEVLPILQSPVCSPTMNEVNPILRPIPIIRQVGSSQINNNKPISAFNLSDFEADTSSPFDSVELKTINDLEELAQVLQPSAGVEVPSFYQNANLPDENFGNTHQLMNSNHISGEQSFNHPCTDKMLSKSGLNYQPHLNGLSASYNYNSLHSYHPQSVISHFNPHSQTSAYNFAERKQMSQSSDVTYSYPLQDAQQQFQNYYSSSAWQPVDPCRATNYQPTSFHSSVVGAGNIAVPLNSVVNFPSSSSPDQPPDSSINSVALQLSDLMKSRSSKLQSKSNQEHIVEESTVAAALSSLPAEEDPFHSLSIESQLLVRKFVEMGFPRSRVSRACQILGCNDKKVIDFLLSLQSLLDAGYEEEQSEQALSLHSQDVNAASRFLQAESQLLGLGFPKERVSEALVKFNCDRDKALDFLIS